VTEQDRTDHRSYIDAVVGELEALGIKTDGLVGIALGESRRAMGIRLEGEVFWDNPRFENTIYADVEWDEEVGWTLHITHELGAARGYGHGRYGLGLGLVPEPADVALYVEKVFRTEGYSLYDRGHERRRAVDHDPELEAALAAHHPN
jgi:hypothetical protein